MSGCARRWKTEVSQHRFGDLKLFELKTMYLLVTLS